MLTCCKLFSVNSFETDYIICSAFLWTFSGSSKVKYTNEMLLLFSSELFVMQYGQLIGIFIGHYVTYS